MHRKNLIRHVSNKLVLVFTMLAAIFSACDTLEQDSLDGQSNVELRSDPVVLTTNSSGIIDLNSLVTSSSGNHRFIISSQPKLGKLEALGEELVRYTKNDGVTEGSDGFKVAIYGNNNFLLKEDSIKIIIKKDSADIPCGVYAFEDYIYNITGPVVIDVSANDFICVDDSTAIKVELVKKFPKEKDFNPDPAFGTVRLLSGNRIEYTPGSGFEGYDKFLYRLVKPKHVPNHGDPEEVSYGWVHIGKSLPCGGIVALEDDFFVFSLDSIQFPDTVYLNVNRNDMFCDSTTNNFLFTLVDFPEGSVDYADNYNFTYVMPPGITDDFTDEFSYKVCVDTVCSQAEVTIKINR